MEMGLRKIIKNLVEWSYRGDADSGTEVTYRDTVLAKSAYPMPPHANNDLSGYNNGTTFTIYNANGGTVIQTTTVDPRTDRMFTKLYVIPEGQDLGEELGLILTREALSK